MKNSVIDCIEIQLTETIIELYEFYEQILKFIEENWKKYAKNYDHQQNRSILLKNLDKFRPFGQNNEPVCSKKLASNSNQCSKHDLNEKHICSSSFKINSQLKFYELNEWQTMANKLNENIENFIEKFHKFSEKLLKIFMKINIEFTKIKPRITDNEIDIYMKIVENLLSLSDYYDDFDTDFDTIYRKRSELFEKSLKHLHFEDISVWLCEYDLNIIMIDLQWKTQNILSKCICFYDYYCKNNDKIIRLLSSSLLNQNYNLNMNSNNNDNEIIDNSSTFYS